MNCRINIGDMMANRAFLSPDLECFVEEESRYTFSQANQRINQLANYLKEKSIYPGDRVAILSKNRSQYVSAIFAIAKADAISVPLNWRLNPAEIEYIINNCGAACLIYDEEFAAVAGQVKSCTGVREFICIGGRGRDTTYEEALDTRRTNEPLFVSGGDDTAVIMYTSGTTGSPKGVMLTHNNLFFVTAGHSHTINWKFKDRFLSVAPLFHIGGLAPMITNIYCGCTTVFLPDFNPVKVWDLVEKERITFMMTVPAMTAAMLRVPGLEKKNLSSLGHIICGASIVPEQLFIEYRKLGVELENVFGITEYAGAVTFWTHEMGWDKHNSVGKPVFHGNVKIVDPITREELPNGRIGEICITGPQVFKGYWNNSEATAGVLAGDCYYSGDLGKKDNDEFIYVVDRLKDMIISGGENIYPAELEAVIAQHPGISDVAVVGKADEKWGEVPVAFVVKAPGSELNEADVLGICRDRLAKFKSVKEVIFVDSLPRNGVGKLMKHVLRKRLN